jgi:hypothetical protein
VTCVTSRTQASQLYLNTIESKGFHIQCKWLFVQARPPPPPHAPRPFNYNPHRVTFPQALMHRSAFGFATDVSTMRCCR